MTAIVTEGLTRRFGDRTAVDALTLDVRRGEVFGFLGPNGAGKTTTVRMLTALVAPTSGRAVVNGHSVTASADAVRASVGLLTESPGLYPRLTARENLVFFARLQSVSDVERQVRKYLDLLEISDRTNDRAAELSKGMQQKLAIARALLHEPPIVFLDEPTSGLDPEAARIVREFITKLRSEERTVFLTTHNLDEADRLCDRVAVFSQRLLRLDTPSALRRSLYGRWVSLRVASPASDLVERLRRHERVRELEVGESGACRVRVEDPDHDIPELVRALVAWDAHVVAIAEEEISLEQVYFDVIGPRLGDDTAAAGKKPS
ncbi:MAG: ABC transporter ATP-binding protein [Deltaproteobacteria bacterium]|nr:ABC transporter ATP-binding protein [Deltaproteobacteria bacterium]